MNESEIKTLYTNFLTQLQRAEKGDTAHIPFIRNQLPSQPLVHDQEVFQVMVIGGTIFRTGIMKREGNEIVLLHIESEHLPIFPTKDALLTFVEKNTKKDIRVLAINFAYPMTPVFTNKRLDGILLAPNKGNAFEGLIGEKVGETIEHHLKQKRNQEVIVSVANDTAGLALSGLTSHNWDEIAGGIVGTGMNFAIMLDGHTVINLEAGTFDMVAQTPGGKLADSLSANPGKYLLEKEVSGKHLFHHFNSLVEQHIIACDPLKSTLQLSIIAEVNIPSVSEHAQRILADSAKRAACVVASILSYSKRDLFFIMQGSLFWKAYQYQEVVEQTVKELEPNYHAEFVQIENADLLGAAKLVA